MDRSWMYNMTNVGHLGLMPELVDDVDGFVDYAMTLEPFQLDGLVKCPCSKCKCRNYEKSDIVKLHLYRNGFKEDYIVWTSHGEVDNSFVRSQNYVAGESSGVVEPDVQNYRMHDMIRDTYGMHSDFESSDHVEEAPNNESKCFFEQLEAFSWPLYEGIPHSELCIAIRLLSIKSDWNVLQGAMDAVIDLMHELVDPNLEIPDNFYKAKRLVSKLGLSSMRIDCCENGCMLYYKDDIDLESFAVKKQQHRIEGSMCEAYLTKEMTDFCLYYFASDIPCSRNRTNHYDNGGEVAREPLSIFNQPGEGSKKRTRRHLSSIEFKSASIHQVYYAPYPLHADKLDWWAVIKIKTVGRVEVENLLDCLTHITLNPGNLQPSSVSTPQIGISSLPLRGIISEPKISTIDQSITHGQVHPQVGMREMHNRLIIEPDSYGFNPDAAVSILSQIIQDLYKGAVTSSGKMPDNLKNQILLEFRRKCFWHPEHEAQIKVNFKLKAWRILTGLLSKAREKNKKPRWILPENWQKLVKYWETDSRFKKMREIGKKARASLKGGSLHTSRAQSQGNIRRKLEKELGRPITQAEAFKATHTRKKKTPKDPDVWVDPRAKLTYNFRQTLPEDRRDLPLSQKQNERIWLDTVGGLSSF
ncbi:hypothetical protein P3S68_026109 [Capsicum galapagoense]